MELSRNLSLLVSNRPESEEYIDVKKYRKKGRDVTRKRRILTSLAEKDGYVVSKKACYFPVKLYNAFVCSTLVGYQLDRIGFIHFFFFYQSTTYLWSSLIMPFLGVWNLNADDFFLVFNILLLRSLFAEIMRKIHKRINRPQIVYRKRPKHLKTILTEMTKPFTKMRADVN